MSGKTCCMSCGKRFPGCHSECEDYKTWIAAESERKAKVKSAKDAINESRSYVRDYYDKVRRKK